MKFLLVLAFSMMSGSAFANTCAATSPQHCNSSVKCLALNKTDAVRFKFEGDKCSVIDTQVQAEDCLKGNQGARVTSPPEKVTPAAGAPGAPVAPGAIKR